jgi:hypothetical protein
MAFTARTEEYFNAPSLTTPFDATVNKPSGTVEGDILFALISSQTAGGANIDSAPSGWTKLGDNTDNNDRYALYYKIAGPSEPPSYTWSFSGSCKARIVCSCYTGGDFNASDPIDVVSNTPYRTSDSSVQAASMSVATINSPLAFFASVYATVARTFTKPSNPTNDWVEDDDTYHADPDFSVEVCSMIWSGSGATGNMAATIVGNYSTKHAFAVALKPAGGTTHYGSATMAGTGSLAAIAHVTHKGSATMSGTGSLAAKGAYLRKAAATLSGAGTLAAAARRIRSATATMSGTGSLAAAARRIRSATATMSGTGTLAAVGRVTRRGKATMAGTGTLAAAGTILGAMVYGAATLSGTGSLAVLATVYHISPTLLAAQKSPHRLPYVEAKVYDYEQGIKRLTWTRLYEGEEADNHHGIAFDGEGSMHRIRADTGSKLYYQKITNPGPTSDYSQWTQIASDCSGPCAIAAYGSKVYIFYRTSTNVLWKYYSHNYGSSWTNAQLTATADVLSMAACWKGATSTVVCFAVTTIEICAIVLDTSDQATTVYYKYHGLDTTYGIGATYQEGEFPIVLAGKDTDAGTSIVSYALYSTKLSDIYTFSSLRVLLTADEDVATAFRYPDCHLPDAAQEYETLQLTVVEDYSGITAYTRPLLAHLVKDTAWSDATITEPRPLFPDPSPYGLRLSSTDSTNSTNPSWWFSTPDGVWRAPRPAADPLDLTPYIQQLHQVIGHQRPGSLVLQLDNSKGYFASPGEGALASLRFRAEVQLRLGYKTTSGPEALDNLTYWIDSWKYSTTQQAQSTLTLFCVDLWGLASAWAARYSLRWNYTTFQPCRVWEILYQFLGRLGIRLWNNPDAPKSTAIDNYYPKFLSRGGTLADTQLRRLLSFVTDGLVPTQAICFAKDLLPAESSSYSYSTNPSNPTNSHPLYAGAYASKLTTTHTQVSGDTEDEPPVHVREAAFDWDLLSLGIDNLRMQYDANLEATDQAAKRADALLRHETLGATGDQIVVPTNVDQELYDIITVTDKRCGIDQAKYRVLAIQTDYDRHKSLYEQRLTLGAS